MKNSKNLHKVVFLQLIDSNYNPIDNKECRGRLDSLNKYYLFKSIVSIGAKTDTAEIVLQSNNFDELSLYKKEYFLKLCNLHNCHCLFFQSKDFIDISIDHTTQEIEFISNSGRYGINQSVIRLIDTQYNYRNIYVSSIPKE